MMDLISALEAVLFAAGEPLPVARLSLVFGVEQQEIELAANELIERYEHEGRGMRIVRMDAKLQMCSAPEFAALITKTLEQRKPPMLSQSALETMAIVAYFQPVTRAYIDQVRGVDSSYTVGALTERGLIEPCGRLDVPGRPTLFQTTDLFLRTMGVEKLEDLPVLPDLSQGEGVEQLQKSIEALEQAENTQISIDEVE
ncbi:MAG: SMC-Scp complex subunit ScpB [Oscillospiraceae bacterium]|nr:SMC-Scp complex subunit ScpB [Oscillospiraceae bacterium]